LFDPLGNEADVVYLIANSSLVFGPDPKGRSEEVTFVGPVNCGGRDHEEREADRGPVGRPEGGLARLRRRKLIHGKTSSSVAT
jgi:hypothetical protein